MLPAEPTENAEPMEPIEHTDPIDPIDRIEPLLPMERNEWSDARDRREVLMALSYHLRPGGPLRPAPGGREGIWAPR